MTTNPELPRRQILVGDACQQLKTLPNNSADTVITSPPYFALRDYGHEQQLGLEESVDAWVRNLLAVAQEISRVLKPTGSFWLNVGDSYSRHLNEGARKKSLLLAPQRLALALSAAGWIVRNHVVWAKTNPMPSNVTDRLSNTHESIYFLTREGRYHFDLDAIRQPHKDDRPHGRPRNEPRSYPPPNVLPRREAGAADVNRGLDRLKEAGIAGHPLGKNPGDVWAMGTSAYHGDHFATFPTQLVERPLRATCPERVCTGCGTPWQRAKQWIDGRWLAKGPLKPACDCNADWRPGVALDPFMGTGTVALVAEQLRRDWVGIELNPVYAALAEQRLAEWREKQKAKK